MGDKGPNHLPKSWAYPFFRSNPFSVLPCFRWTAPGDGKRKMQFSYVKRVLSQVISLLVIVVTSGSRGGGGAPRPWPPPNAKLARPNYVLASPQTGQWVYLVSTKSTDFTGFMTQKRKKLRLRRQSISSNNNLGIEEASQLQDESGPRRIDQGPEGRIIGSNVWFGSARHGFMWGSTRLILSRLRLGSSSVPLGLSPSSGLWLGWAGN